MIKNYYKISQDHQAKAPKLIYSYDMINRNEPKDATQIFIRDDERFDFVDLLEVPFLMVTDDFKKVVQMYNKNYKYNAVRLTESDGDGMIYWYIDLPMIDVQKTPMDKWNVSFFKYKNGRASRAIYYIRLDLLESLLRRGVSIFKLDEI